MENKSSVAQSSYVHQSSASPSSSAAVASQPIMRPLASTKHGVPGAAAFLILVLMVVLGIGAGYGASLYSAKTGTSIVPNVLNSNAPVKGKVYGSGDTSVFKDT